MGKPAGRSSDDVVVVGGDARQRFHDARGYGNPQSGGALALTPIEAAHLLARGDLASVDGMGLEAFLAQHGDGAFGIRFLVYADMRRRGYYLWPVRWVEDAPPSTDFVVFERGSGPAENRRAYELRVIGERTPVSAASLRPQTLAIVDEEGAVTYFDIVDDPFTFADQPTYPWRPEAVVLGDRLVLWAPPPAVHREAFFGQPLWEATDGPIHISLVEGAYLAGRDAIDVDGGEPALLERGRAVEGPRFDRRLTVYSALRDGGLVPKTGFKFGADFRVYGAVTSVEDLGHSDALVRVVAHDHTFEPRALSHDVRLAQGVRKRMVFARPVANGETEISWRAVGRITP